MAQHQDPPGPSQSWTLKLHTEGSALRGRALLARWALWFYSNISCDLY